ncbi:hypothetical protein G6F37_007732 [Rhizopus arrhizus]|nr:hypothetical protein G6F38_007941 [Rhizopus arrhizus]KAG1156305.1 hypothetical protein G6F37_007732 [Rhizopus arrhizus]
MSLKGPKKFYSNNPAEDWNFENYYQLTQAKLNKRKNNMIMTSFKQDLNWIANKQNLTRHITDYAMALSSQPIATEMKVKLSKDANKRRRASHFQKIIGSRKRKIEGVDKENDETDANEESGDINDGKDDGNAAGGHLPSLWKKWLEFMEKEKVKFYPYSPVSHNIIWCGKGVSHLPYIKEDLYLEHTNIHENQRFPIPESCTEYMDKIVDSAGLKLSKR